MAFSEVKELSREALAHVCREGDLQRFIAEEQAFDGLFMYMTQLLKWNKVMNLVGRTCWQDVLRTLIADSVYLADFIENIPLCYPPSLTPECWDLGAGAGLPGIPLRLLWQHGHYTLVEVREKRALFLKTVLAAQSLGQTTVFQGRAEDFMPSRLPANLVVSRAFMPWEKVWELVAPFMSDCGTVVFLALKPAPQDSIVYYGGKMWSVEKERHYCIGDDSRYLWALQVR